MNLKQYLLSFVLLFWFVVRTSDSFQYLYQIEMNALNETVFLSPVQVMYVGLWILALAILAIFGYTPINVTPVFTGRALPTGPHLPSVEDMGSYWTIGKVHFEFESSNRITCVAFDQRVRISRSKAFIIIIFSNRN